MLKTAAGSAAHQDIEEGECPEPSLNEFQGGEDFDDEYARMAQHVGKPRA